MERASSVKGTPPGGMTCCPWRRMLLVCGCVAGVASASGFNPEEPTPDPVVVLAERESEPIASEGDAADDLCIWIHPTRPSQSLVVGTDKRRGLVVYDLQGNRIQELPGGEPNNIDHRAGLTFGQESWDIFVAGDREANALAFWSIDVASRKLYPLGRIELERDVKVYGSCLYHSSKSAACYVFVTSKQGDVQQWKITLEKAENPRAPLLKGELVRRLKVDTKVEGCVADDELGWLYVAEEDRGIWRFAAEPGDSAQPVRVDGTIPQGHLTADVEGLALYRGAEGTGYLLASSQGSNSFAIYERSPSNTYLGQFTIGQGPSIDSVSHTDGIDVTSVNLGSPFADGLLVVQDSTNDMGNQNFKFVPWKNIAVPFRLALVPGHSARGQVSPKGRSTKPSRASGARSRVQVRNGHRHECRYRRALGWYATKNGWNINAHPGSMPYHPAARAWARFPIGSFPIPSSWHDISALRSGDFYPPKLPDMI